MAIKRTKSDKRPLEQYSHVDKKRVNNPPVGLVTPDTDQTETKRAWSARQILYQWE
jgi:adenine-specific DNA-methyltransferase